MRNKKRILLIIGVVLFLGAAVSFGASGELRGKPVVLVAGRLGDGWTGRLLRQNIQDV